MAKHKIGEMDIEAQEGTFDGFVSWMTRSVVVVLVLLVGMAIFIS